MESYPSKIAGILKLTSMYKFKSTNKLEAFLFEPLDSKLPNFTVQSSIGKTSNEDHAVIIEYMNNLLELPRGNIVQILGPITSEEAIYKLHLHHLGVFPKSIKLPIDMKPTIESEPTFPLEIYSIDPDGCQDIDDAFSYCLTETNLKLYIHISNVSQFLNQLGILNLVLNYSITSIYPPNSNVIHMLPKLLSTNYLSLLEKTVRQLITLEISYDLTFETWSYKFYQSIGKITRNYSYDKYPKRFNELFPIITKLYSKITNDSSSKMEITDTHKLIEAFMLIYNYLASIELSDIETTIYRIQDESLWEKPICLPSDLTNFLSILHSNSAIYTNEKKKHSSLSLESYCHITSPIRRVVDIYNQHLLLSKLKGEPIGEITIDLMKINETNRILKRLYRDFETYALSISLYNEMEGFETDYLGYIYDYNENVVSIYIPNLKRSINYRLFDYKLDDIYQVNFIDSSFIEVYNKQTNEIENKLELNKAYSIRIFGKPNPKKLNQSILLEFL